MKALALTGKGHLELLEVQAPVPDKDQVLIKTAFSTICTSDLIDIDHNPSGLTFPTVLGHEGSGTVVAVGSLVQGFLPGQHVAAHPVHPCRRCATCAAGNGHLCPQMGHFGLNMPGTFAEYFLARADRVRVVTDGAAWASLAEPVAVCLEALDQARLVPGATLLIIGDGPFGVMMARLARSLRLRRVVLAGWSDFRLGFAPDAVTVNTKGRRDAGTALLEGNGSAAYDAVILAVGSAEAVSLGLGCLKPRGRIVLFSGFLEPQKIDLNHVHLKELELVGACNDRDRFDEAVAFLTDAAWSEIITHRFPLADFERAFELARAHKDECLKVALTFPGSKA